LSRLSFSLYLQFDPKGYYMKRCFLLTRIILSCFLFTHCTSTYQPQSVEFFDYRIQSAAKADSSIVKLIKPYADSVHKSMNDEIGTLEMSLEKKQPEGTLNNLTADIMLEAARKKFNTKVDAAILNYGGIRLTQLAAGPLTKGKIFELSPFDNTIVLLTIPGSNFQQFLNLAAEKGGWPVAGLTMTIRDKKALNVQVQGSALDTNRIYTIATVDYIANGGDNTVMLAGLPRRDNGYLFRDAIIEYITELTSKGQRIRGVLDNRVIVSE
jgi:2',3'-cyclic-nucleotide 2'-phosphodiesterase (5'-nucleotidase family)